MEHKDGVTYYYIIVYPDFEIWENEEDILMRSRN